MKSVIRLPYAVDTMGLQRQRDRGWSVRSPNLADVAAKVWPALVAACRSPYVVGGCLAALAVVYRLVLVQTALATVDSDQAVLGIMARHILHGDRPIFFYGQSYQGALEAYLTAAVFALWGQSDLMLRVVPSLFSALLVVQLYGLARRLYRPRVATITGLWLALPAPVLAYWGTAAGAGYVEVMVLGSALYLIAVRRWGLGRPRRYDLAALGLLTGLGVWVQPVVVYYLVALALAYAPLLWRLHRRSSRGTRASSARSPRRPTNSSMVLHAWPLVAGFVIGAAPWLEYTLRHGGAAFSVFSARGAAVPLTDAVTRLGSETLPLLLGGALPNTYAAGFAGYVNGHDVPYALALLALGYLMVRLLISPGGIMAQARALLAARPLPDAPLALLPFVVLVIYLLSPFEALSWTTHNPRYLLPLYTATPYLVACALPVATRASRWRRRRRRGIWRLLAPPAISSRFMAYRSIGVSSALAGEWARADTARLRMSSLFLKAHGTGTTSEDVQADGPAARLHDPSGVGAHRRRNEPMARVAPAPTQRPREMHKGAGTPAWLRAAFGLYLDGARALARPAMVAIMAVALALNVYGSAHYEAPSRVTPLAAALVARGDGAVYCLYWLAWRLAFESGERLIPVVTDGLAVDPHDNGNRYPPYLARARTVRRWAYVLPYDVGAPQLEALLRRDNVPYSRWRWGNDSVFDGPVSKRFPPAASAGTSEPSPASRVAAATAR